MKGSRMKAPPYPEGVIYYSPRLPRPSGLPWVSVHFHAGLNLKGLRNAMMIPKPLQSFTKRTMVS